MPYGKSKKNKYADGANRKQKCTEMRNSSNGEPKILFPIQIAVLKCGLKDPVL